MTSHKDYVLNYIDQNSFLVSFESLIGAGKSTLCKSIDYTLDSYDYPTIWYPEPINRSFVKLFYSNIPRYAFSFQSIIIRERTHIYTDGLKFVMNNGGIAAIDRGPYGDLSFALMHRKSGNINPAEFAVYTELIEEYPFPTNEIRSKYTDVKRYVVYLECSPEKCRERIIKRGNQEEIDGVTLEYLQGLEDSYFKILKEDGLDSEERIALNQIKTSCLTTKSVFLDYNQDLQINSEGLIIEEQVFDILYEIIRQIE